LVTADVDLDSSSAGLPRLLSLEGMPFFMLLPCPKTYRALIMIRAKLCCGSSLRDCPFRFFFAHRLYHGFDRLLKCDDMARAVAQPTRSISTMGRKWCAAQSTEL
jgi:hypothetical protein